MVNLREGSVPDSEIDFIIPKVEDEVEAVRSRPVRVSASRGTIDRPEAKKSNIIPGSKPHQPRQETSV